MEQDQPEKAKVEYESLDNENRIRAILGAIMEPIIKSEVLRYSGINYSELDHTAKARIDAVFSEAEVEITKDEKGDKYQLSKGATEKLAQSVEMATVHGTIVDAILKGQNIP